MKTFQIHLIRHGQTEGNLRGQYIGRIDLPVTREGLKSLKRKKEESSYPKVEAVFSSPMRRCIETAGVLYPGADVTEIAELREYDFGVFEGKTAQELDGRPDYMAWCAGKMAPPEGEDIRGFAERLCLGLNRVVREMMARSVTSAAVIMHGGAIMMLLSVCGLPRRGLLEWTVDNGCGYTVRITPSLYQRSGVVEVIGEVPCERPEQGGE